jgi:hypothetical protein
LNPEALSQKVHKRNNQTRPPFTCRVFLLMALTYYGILNLLFLGMLVFSGYIRKATEHWFEAESITNTSLILFIIIGLLILLMCTSGITLFLYRRKGGFYLYLAGAVILWVADFFLLEFDWMRYLINSGFIFILGIMHFTGRCYNKGVLKDEN